MSNRSLKQEVWRKADRFVRNSPLLSSLLGDLVFEQRWKTELALLRNKNISSSTHPSVIHLSLNRSATQWVKSVLSRVGDTVGLVHVRWNEMAFDSSYPFLDNLETVEGYSHIFRPHGYLYSAFGGYPIGIPDLQKYRVILVVRDPRDILVSRYYSKAMSHRLPFYGSDKRDKLVRERKRAQNQSIDAFVRSASDKLLKTYNTYLEKLLTDHPDVHVTRYEDMVFDVEKWLKKLTGYIGVDPPIGLKNKIIEEAENIKKKEENKRSHVRKGSPGDYKNKLNTETIKYLNKKFKKVISFFGYNN